MRRKIVIIYRACREAQLESLKRTVLDMNNRVLFLISKGVSYVGTKLFSFALSWYILKQTGSGLGFSISLLVNYIFVQDDLRGKVIGTLTAVSYSLIPISLLLTGAAVDMIKSYAIPLICGGLLVVLLGCIKLLDLRVNNPAQMEDN